MPFLIYNITITLFAIILSPLILALLLSTPRKRAGFWQKMGFYGKDKSSDKTIWVHAVSVGEVLAAKELIKKIKEKRADLEIILTTTTPTGMEVAKRSFDSMAQTLYFPYDFPWSVKNAIKRINPAVFITIDTEIWPNVIRGCKRHGAKVALTNGRISDKSYPSYMKWSFLINPLLAMVDLCLMQGDRDVDRIIAMGAKGDNVFLAGVMKFDREVLPVDEKRKEELRISVGISPLAKVFMLGSLHEGEEEAIKGAIKVKGEIENLSIVIAPRRVDDIGWIEKAISGTDLYVVRKSSIKIPPSVDEKRVLVIDTFGELSDLYAISDVVFVGGSLINHGGQNPIEPSAHGIAPMFGKDMKNFRDSAALLLEGGGAFIVESSDDISRHAVAVLKNDNERVSAGRRAREIVVKNRGATEKIAERILEGV